MVYKSGVWNRARQRYTCKAACNLWLPRRILFYQAVSANSLCVLLAKSGPLPSQYCIWFVALYSPPVLKISEINLICSASKHRESPEIIPPVTPQTVVAVRRKFSEANGKPLGVWKHMNYLFAAWPRASFKCKISNGPLLCSLKYSLKLYRC